MNKNFLKTIAFLCLSWPVLLFATESTGTGSMIPVPLIKAWNDAYVQRFPLSNIKYNGSNPADGIKKVVGKEVDFSTIDMPLSLEELKKDNLFQFPFVLGGIAPIVNLPNVYQGQFRLDAQAMGDIFLGKIKKWNDPALVALNPDIELPDAGIIIVHRISPPGISTIIGDYLAKNNPQWKALKGDGMAGAWPASAIEVKDPIENIQMIKKTVYSIGYGPIPQIMKNGLNYAQVRNKAGKYVSPGDLNISAAAENAKWDESKGFDVVLTDQPGETTWPLTFADFVIMRKVSPRQAQSKDVLTFFKYNLKNSGLRAFKNDFIPLPDSVIKIIVPSLSSIVDEQGVQILKQ